MHIVFFFFKQKTADEMRISDWSSDVCSSDLAVGDEAVGQQVVLGCRVVGDGAVDAVVVADHQALRRDEAGGAATQADHRVQRLGGEVRQVFGRHLQAARLELRGDFGHLLRLPHALEANRSEEHTSEPQSLMRISNAVFCLKKKLAYTNNT